MGGAVKTGRVSAIRAASCGSMTCADRQRWASVCRSTKALAPRNRPNEQGERQARTERQREVLRAAGIEMGKANASGFPLRASEIAVRAVCALGALVMSLALMGGFWSPSLERVGQWLLALVLLFTFSHLLRSVFGALGEEVSTRRRRAPGSAARGGHSTCPRLSDEGGERDRRGSSSALGRAASASGRNRVARFRYASGSTRPACWPANQCWQHLILE